MKKCSSDNAISVKNVINDSMTLQKQSFLTITDLEIKTKAVGEVFLGTGTLELIGAKYGISPSYLSTLASRARRSMARKGFGSEGDIHDQEARLATVIRDKVFDLREVGDKISKISGELEENLG
jgi:hypothetical protein